MVKRGSKTFYAVKCNHCGDYNKGGDYTPNKPFDGKFYYEKLKANEK